MKQRPMEQIVTEAERHRRIFVLLESAYPQAGTGLRYDNPFQLFVAVLLSAQTTDKQVNRITAPLFAAVPTARAMAGLEPEELEPYLKSCGLFRNKSRYLVAASRMIVEDFGGVLPDNFADLTSLPGIGRKSANVILSAAFGKPALAVDTHVFRVARRLGLAGADSPAGVEDELKEKFPPHEWGPLHHRLIAHGRAVCQARRPQCARCVLKDCCAERRAAVAMADRSGPPQE
ncbi:MAG: endonuclease III [Firmicutes bacterium]|nr:endonuclease III [Bacillota bacterium]